MSEQEWEKLCDGCGRCCLHKVEDAADAQVYFTAIACRFLDIPTCRCTCYGERRHKNHSCLRLTPDTDSSSFRWLPETCAYRAIAEGRDLSWWHPLVSGDPETVHTAGISVRGIAVSEEHIHPDELEEYLSSLIIESCPPPKIRHKK